MTEDEARAAGEALAKYRFRNWRFRSDGTKHYYDSDPIWLHVRFEEADGEGPMWDGEDVVTSGHDDRWVELGTDEEIDVGRVERWAPLPDDCPPTERNDWRGR